MKMPVQQRLRALRQTHGFSLTEVVLAIAIVGIAVVGVMTAFPVGMTASRDSRDDNVVSSIAEDVISWIRAQAFDNVILPNGDTVKMDSQGSNGLAYETSNGNLFYYTVSGDPARQGTYKGPSDTEPYREDEGYFGVKVTVINNPYNTVPSLGSATADISKLQNMAKVIVDISWPARAPLTPVDRRQHSVFVTYVANVN